MTKNWYSTLCINAVKCRRHAIILLRTTRTTLLNVFHDLVRVRHTINHMYASIDVVMPILEIVMNAARYTRYTPDS